MSQFLIEIQTVSYNEIRGNFKSNDIYLEIKFSQFWLQQ